ncbi:tape measure protein [Leuconostoc gasicomitatum]|uniref:tape measure protein n=1 Tax=Leuconostoc gasicomitatum TaxID=115778 RepID=UPI0007E23370|nr:tape measure protein [Leuconostoc gasicomitatum]CUW06543.1 Phage tail length tape-measure protein [Leuconostoc gasicomitatum]
MAQITNVMANNLTLDVSSAQSSLRELTSTVKDSTNEWKIQEAQLKSSGDAANASKARYEGLQQTLEAQKTKVDSLKQALNNNNTETKKGQELQTFLTNELAKAERQYSSYQGQLDKATQSYKYQESGLAELNKELKHGNELTDARVQKLEAEGRTEEAAKVKLDGLKTTQENYTKQLKIQQDELKTLSDSGDKSSESYKRQALRVEQMGAKLAETTRDIKDFNHTDIKPETSGIGRVRGQLEQLNNSLEGTRSRFKTIFLGNLVANGVTSMLSSVKSHFTGAIEAGVAYNKQMENVKIGLDNFTNSNADLTDKLLNNIKSVKESSGYATDTVTLLTKKTYGLTKSADGAKELTDAFTNLGRATGKSDEGLQGLVTKLFQANASGKITSGALTKLNKDLPGFTDTLGKNLNVTREQLGKLASDGKLKMSDLGNAIKTMSDSKPQGLENYYKTVDGFTNHFEERYKSLSGKITEGFFAQSNGLLASVSKSLDGKDVDKSFNRMGDSANKAVNTIFKAFSSTFKGSKTNPIADVANFTADSIEKLGNFVAKHAEDIKSFFKMIKELGATGFSTMGTTLKIALPLLDELGKFATKHPTTFKILAGSILGLNFALKTTLGTMALFGKGKAVFGALSGLIIKPKVDGSDAKRELGVIGKLAKGIGTGVWWTAKLAGKAVWKTLELIGSAVVGVGKGLLWTANLAWSGVKKSLSLIGTVGKATGRALKWSASIATKGAKVALTGLLATAKFTGNGIKLAFNFMKANPLILLVSAITAVVVAFVELYKHNKKFRDFVNGLVKGAKDFFVGIGKWFGQAWKAISKFFGQMLNFLKKDWKEVLLLLVNPFAGAFALLYKHNDKFRKNVNQLVQDVIGFFKDMGKNISNIFNSIKNFIGNTLGSISKTWSNGWNAIYNVQKDIWNSIIKFIWSAINSVLDTINKVLGWIGKTWSNGWNNIFNFFKNTWNGMKSFGSDAIWSIHNTFSNILGKIGSVFSSTWKGIKNGFSDMWDGMKKLAGDGINAVIHIPNMGIDGINGLIHDFGGPKSALGKIPKVAFANGTGTIDKLTHAVLNDGNDSPATGNKEAIVHPNGEFEIVQGRNTGRLLLPGTEVIKASDLAKIMGPTPFANGTGFLGSIWDGVKSAGSWVGRTAGNAWDGIKDATDKFTKMFGFITGAIAHPVKTLEKVFNPVASGMGSVMNGIGGGAFTHVKDQAVDWWQSLWGMANDEASGGSNSELLKQVIKLGTGKPYVWGAAGPDSFDCSGLVEYALSQMGKGFPKYSGAQFNASDAVSDPKSGDLAFFGAGGSEHVGVYGGNGKMFSAMSPGSNPNIGWANISDWSEQLAGYHRVPGLKSDDTQQSSNPMSSLIKSQVGGMFDWIKKFIAPTQESANPAGDGVGRWSGDVKRALSQLGLSTSDSMVSKILKQIQTESGGNAGAIGGNDGLADGNATGLMQVKPGTFNAFALAGHGNIMNGYDNMLAGINYAKSRYGNDLSFLGQGHGYANGGLITKNQMIEVGEGNKPEMIIPLDGMKSSRGFELLGKTAVAMAGRDGKLNQPTADNSGLANKLDTMIGLLANLVTGQSNPTPAVVSANQAQDVLNKLKQTNNRSQLLYQG